MSRIDQLIEKLSPNGVEWKQLNEVIVSLNTGLNPRQFFKLNTSDANNYYVTIREIHNQKIVFSDKTDRLNDEALRLCNNRSNLERGDVLFSGTGTIGETAVLEETPTNWNIKEGVYSIKPIQGKISSRFLMYLLSSSEIRNDYMKKAAGGTVKSVPMSELRKLQIPVPPLPVQEEIVRILDAFTELEAELEEELEARKKQYEHYRDTLLTLDKPTGCVRIDRLIAEFCPNGVEIRKIKDVFQRLKGTPITASKMKEIASPNAEIRIFAGGKTVIDAKEETIPNANITRVPAVLVQSRGVIDVVYYEKPFTFKNEMWAYTTNNKTTVKYLFYVLKNSIQTLRDAASGMGSLPQISLSVTEDMKIPVPPLPVQEEIVRILDRFDKLCNDISDGLPAEIEARHKQYEYYRDKLLTFKELEA